MRTIEFKDEVQEVDIKKREIVINDTVPTTETISIERLERDIANIDKHIESLNIKKTEILAKIEEVKTELNIVDGVTTK